MDEVQLYNDNDARQELLDWERFDGDPVNIRLK